MSRSLRVAAYQLDQQKVHKRGQAITAIKESLDRCEQDGVEFLCCPEACLGGLADQTDYPEDIAISTTSGELEAALAPLGSSKVVVILGFSERAQTGTLHNSAAVYCEGTILGIYRKNQPAINRSIYIAGDELPVFSARGVRFGIQICNDSNFPEQSETLAAKGAQILFIPTNNYLPQEKADVLCATRECDVMLAKRTSMYVARADVVGRNEEFIAYGTTKIVRPDGIIMAEALSFETGLIMATLTVD